MNQDIYAPRIVCKICGQEVTSVMEDVLVTPRAVIHTFTCSCESCMYDFEATLTKYIDGTITTETSQ